MLTAVAHEQLPHRLDLFLRKAYTKIIYHDTIHLNVRNIQMRFEAFLGIPMFLASASLSDAFDTEGTQIVAGPTPLQTLGEIQSRLEVYVHLVLCAAPIQNIMAKCIDRIFREAESKL